LALAWGDTTESLRRELESCTVEQIGDTAFLIHTETPKISFYRQILPNPKILENASIRETAECAFGLVEGVVGEWSLHSFSAQDKGGERRATLVESILEETLKKKRKSVLKLRAHSFPTKTLLQICVLSEGVSVVSLTPDITLEPARNLIVPLSGGRAEIPEDKRPPSRAYRKLKEALLSIGLGIEPGQQVVDLGASPGSWSWVALESGAVVTAVDRSELSGFMVNESNLRFESGDAFKFKPDSQVDWLLSDIITAPERTVQLLDGWLKERLCRNFCVTMKFKGEPDWTAIQAMRSLLERESPRFLLRHLENNKNEITAVGIAS
jgi:23S rRNA (cytidine2498-2'-O)-methyltransferase